MLTQTNQRRQVMSTNHELSDNLISKISDLVSEARGEYTSHGNPVTVDEVIEEIQYQYEIQQEDEEHE
jgi:hypothetical protein